VGYEGWNEGICLKPINFPQFRFIQPRCVQSIQQLWHNTSLEDPDPLLGVQARMPPGPRQFVEFTLGFNRLQISGPTTPEASKQFPKYEMDFFACKEASVRGCDRSSHPIGIPGISSTWGDDNNSFPLTQCMSFAIVTPIACFGVRPRCILTADMDEWIYTSDV